MAELEFLIEAPERGRVVAFPSKSFMIGSGPSCAVRFQSDLVSAEHAEVVMDSRGQWWIRDLAGSGSVAVNNTLVIDERLSSGDRLRIGDVRLLIQDSGVSARARTRSGEALAAAVPLSSELRPDVVIDNRYKIIGKIAEGGMGEVYKAVHVELGRPLALKVMLPELSNDQEFVGRFKREAIASSRIGHPNIIDISDFGRTPDGRFYFVMEYVDGKTLIKYRREGPFRFERVVHVGLQTARALAAAHAVNIIHRDLKPENIMLVQRAGQPDFVKVLDFGIAKVLGAGASGAFTAIGSVVGTPQYMAPEQASAGVVDTRSDIYSLGLIFHELIRGRPTFTGDSAVELMSRQLDTPPPPLRSPWGTVPAPLERIIMQMLEKVPDQRPASMEAVIAAFEAVQSTPTPARTEPIAAPEIAAASEAPTRSKKVANAKLPAPVQSTNFGVLTAPEVPALTRAQPLTGPQPARTVATGVLQTDRAPTPLPASSGQQDSTAKLAPVSRPESQVDLAAVRPSRAPLIITLLVAIGGLLGAIGWAVTREPAAPPPKPEITPPPKPPEPIADVKPEVAPRAAVVKISVESEQGQVEVYEDDMQIGTTPVVLSRPPGTIATFKFVVKDFLPVVRKVKFESDTTLRVTLEKEKPAVKKPVSTGGQGGGRQAPPQGEDLKELPF